MRAALTREVILAQKSLKQETVDVPEWGGTVLVQELTGAERDAFEASNLKKKGKSVEVNTANIRAKLVVLAARAPDGSRLFTDADVEAIGGLGAGPVSRVFAVAARLSGITEEDVEELAGNSAAEPSGDSPSSSPSGSAAPTSISSSPSSPPQN